ncbi:MAG: capsid cement protein [Methylovulum miyakonense]|uniref:capsid cement protein n=1 Tax=Methylovulum miyakonense TaxID=645578 RepID=UPI003BB73C71
MRNSNPIMTLTVILAGVAAACRFISTARVQAGAGVNTYGVTRTAGVSGDAVPVDMLGTAVVETGAAIAAGALVETDASGRAITKSAGATVARLAPGESASAAGQFIEVILIPN